LALPLYQETLKLTEAKLGPDHTDTITSMYNLAFGYKAAGKLDLALPLFEGAAAGMEKHGFLPRDAKSTLANTITAYEEARQFEQAEGWQRKWLAFSKAKDGEDSLAYADELARLGSLLLAQQKWTDAETALRECGAIQDKQQSDAWTTFATRSQLGEALLGQQQFADAEKHLLDGYEGLKTRAEEIPPQIKKQRLTAALDRLIELAKALEKPDDVAKWQAEKEKLLGEENVAEPPPRPARD
jgi:tetratricopeptide (TPR) repeat protein